MGLIQEGDFTISYNQWGDAIVHHIPSDKTYIGCGSDRHTNLIAALDAMERIQKVKENDIQETSK